MTTLSNALITLARYALPVHSGVATGGNTTTLVDNVRVQANDQFNNGVLFFLTGTYANQYVVVTDYASASGTFTFAALTGTGIVAGVQYAAIALASGVNLYDLIAAINAALVECGEVLQEDATLTTVAEQESYDLPTGVSNVRSVEIATSTASPYNYRPHMHWKELNDDLRFDEGYEPWIAGYKIRLGYLAAHATLDTYEDVISQQINPQWLKYKAALNLVRSLGNRGRNWSDLKVNYEEAQQIVIRLRPTRGIIINVQAA